MPAGRDRGDGAVAAFEVQRTGLGGQGEERAAAQESQRPGGGRPFRLAAIPAGGRGPRGVAPPRPRPLGEAEGRDPLRNALKPREKTGAPAVHAQPPRGGRRMTLP